MATEYGGAQYRTLDQDVIRPTRRPAMQPVMPVSPTLTASSGRVSEFNAPRGQVQPGGVWPPPPRIDQPFVFQTGRLPLTPDAAFRFFFGKFVLYGLTFGIAYGGCVGVFIFIIGAVFGAPIGGILGLILGIPDGLALGYLAAHLVRNGRTVPEVVDAIRMATPITTTISGALLMAGYCLATHESLGAIFVNWFVLVVYGIAILASWHASIVAAKKFDAEYE